jgi:hypothetical protein
MWPINKLNGTINLLLIIIIIITLTVNLWTFSDDFHKYIQHILLHWCNFPYPFLLIDLSKIVWCICYMHWNEPAVKCTISCLSWCLDSPQWCATEPAFPPYSVGRHSFGTCSCNVVQSLPWTWIWNRHLDGQVCLLKCDFGHSHFSF